jgi:hypothetical protein
MTKHQIVAALGATILIIASAQSAFPKNKTGLNPPVLGPAKPSPSPTHPAPVGGIVGGDQRGGYKCPHGFGSPDQPCHQPF